jgi:N-6 DNA methylase
MRNSRSPISSSPSSDDLIRALGHKSDLAQEGVSRIYGMLIERESPDADRSLGRWKTLVSESCGRDPDKPSSHIDRLARTYRISTDRPRPAEMQFALQTYYVLLVRLLVERMVSVPGAVDLLAEEPFVWRAIETSRPVGETARRLGDRLDGFDTAALQEELTEGRDLLGTLYQDLFPRSVRHGLGEYYTPGWLADHVLDAVGYDGNPDERLLDPACGSGTFLLRAMRRIVDRHDRRRSDRPLLDLIESEQNPTRHPTTNDGLAHQILANVVGMDLNPLAVLSARANYLLALADLLTDVDGVRIPIFQQDSILIDGNENAARLEPFEYVVGNPPWIAWDNLPGDYRQATMELWRRYGLFSLSGNEARHGGGKKDLSMLMLYVAADRYLKDHGRLGMVITQTLFQSKGAGDGFRRFRLGDDGPDLGVLQVDDLSRLKPFPNAANWTATVVLEKGHATTYPVPYFKWSGAEDSSRRNRFDRRRCLARPIDPNKDTSPWFVCPEELDLDPDRLVGPSDYVAHLGANSGGANGVYWLEVLEATADGLRVCNIAGRGKKKVDSIEAVIEPDLVYPLVRWSDVSRYRAVPSSHILLAQDPATRRGIDQRTMRDRYPKTLAYLERFAELLTGRAAYRRYQQTAPFYSMYNVGPYTVAPLKVVWRRMDKRINAAVLTEVDDPVLGRRSIIPQETCVLIAADSLDEAHYLVAVLNSSIVDFLVTSHSVHGGKGFATPSMLDFIRLKRFDRHDDRHVELAQLSRRAHRRAANGKDMSEAQRKIDRTAGQLWDLDARQLEALSPA